MGYYHKNEEVNQAIIRLMDSLCSWERDTGRRNTLILIPEPQDENIVIAMDGKPVTTITAKQVVNYAIMARGCEY